MSKNVKSIFLVATLLFLLVGVSAISASEVSDGTTVLEDTADTVASEVTTTTTDNKIVDTTTKNIKTEEQSTDLYVSDTDGSDDNSGTNDSPYKTIQKALDTTNADSTYNIHIAEGTYKGLGNTNLTVNGNYNINFIGDGINKTILDGEVNYSISGSSVWGSDEYWNSYNIYSGNWGLNITTGNGKITISNLNIQNMVSRGGSSISAYQTATIDNYGNLIVDNVFFKDNLAGVGAGIRSNHDSTLVVNNSVFVGNRKSSSTGNDGAGIYNNGTAIVENTEFIRNAARWGTVLNDYVLNITNCTFREGISYDLSSTYKYGSGIAIDSGSADYFNQYELEGIYTNIQNCTFINNGQTDIYQAKNGNLIVNNCNFINSTGIYIANQENTAYVTNSKFTNMQPSTLFGSLSTITGTTFAIYDNSIGTLIENNTINVENNGYAIHVYEKSKIINNTLNNQIYITGNNNTIINNSINTTFYYAIQLESRTRNNSIINNTLYSRVLTGNKAVNDINERFNTIADNTPNTGIIIDLTDDTYNDFFNEEGKLKNNLVENNSIINLKSDLLNKLLNFDDVRVLFNGNNHTIYNTSINIEDNSYTIMKDIKIININTHKPAIISQSSILLINTNITANDTNELKIVVINGDNSELENIRIQSSLPTSQNNTIGLVINSKNNIIDRMILNINSTTTSSGEIIGLFLNNSDNTILTTFPMINMRSNSNITSMMIINTNDVTVELENSTLNATSWTKQIYTENNNNLKIKTKTLNSISQNAMGIILNNNNNTLIELSDSFHMPDNSQSQYVTNASFYLKAELNATGILLNNSNNTKIRAIEQGPLIQSRIQLNCTYGKGIYAINTTDLTLSCISFNNIAQNNRYTKNITGIILQDSQNIDIKNINMTSQSPINTVGSLILLNNTNNTQIYNNDIKFKINLTSQPITLINSNNNTIKNLTINSRNNAIVLTNSNNNSINNNIINTFINSSITLTNSNNNKITDNYINANNINGGNLAIVETNTQNNILENNTPGIIQLTDDNYAEYFINKTLNPEILVVIIDSDIHNKDLKFINPISFRNPNNYTIYNTTITSNSTMILEGLIINTTDDRIHIINASEDFNITNSKIYHENSKEYAQTIYNPEHKTRITNTIINTTAPTKEDKTTSTLVVNQYTIINSLLELNTNNNNNGQLIGIQSNNNEIYSTGTSQNQITNSNITINGVNNVIALLSSVDCQRSYINVVGTNVYGILTEYRADITYSNICLLGQNTTIAQLHNPIDNQHIIINYNNITANGTNLIKINTTGRDKTSNLSFAYNVLNLSNIQTYCENMNTISVSYNNLTLNQTKEIVRVINSNTYNSISNKFKLTGNDSQYIIVLENLNNANIRQNYLLSSQLKGNYAILLDNVIQKTVVNNTPPGDILTDDNYDEYFTDGIFTKENVDSLEIGSDIYNRNMTFNDTIYIINPNNYTLYNITISSTAILNLTGIRIENTDDRTTAIDSKSLLFLNNSSIYHENNENYATVIKIDNPSGFNSQSYPIINNTNITLSGIGSAININHTGNNQGTGLLLIDSSDITISGDNSILINSYESNLNYTNTNLTMKGNNNTLINCNHENIINPYMLYRLFGNNSNINAEGNNLLIINATSYSIGFENNNYIVTGNNSIIINISNAQTYQSNNGGNNYTLKINNSIMLNAYNIPFTSNNNIINLEGDNNTIYHYNNQTNTNLPTEIINNNMTIKTITPTTAIKIFNCSRIKITNNNILIKTNNTNTPIIYLEKISGNNKTRTANNVSDNYLQSYDTYGENAIEIIENQSITIFENNTPTNTNFKSQITNIETPKTIIVKLNNLITVTTTDLFNQEISGIITLTDGQTTTTSTTNTITYIPQTTGQKTLTITYNDPTGKYNSATQTINIEALTPTLTIDPITATVGETINVTARITAGDETITDINKGKVTFKVNGKTLKDANGKVIYAKVVNGVATIENYLIPEDWAKDGSTIEAIYSGSTQCDKLTSEKTEITINKEAPTITTSDITTTAGETITLTATITDNNKIINNGKIVFKINGKTVKDANGKVIYAKVVNNQVSVEYTLPANMKAKDYNITATFISSDYERIEDTKTLTITA